ncbi:MAG: PDZ domain-containing protein, partial [Dehalococcoidia bacterium]|nr:PDZ domain-containing protein [Dehalococcoidia bacterium]
QAGDIITAIDGSAIEGESDLPAALDAHNVGDEVAFTVLRDGSEIAITVVLGEAPTATPTATSSP